MRGAREEEARGEIFWGPQDVVGAGALFRGAQDRLCGAEHFPQTSPSRAPSPELPQTSPSRPPSPELEAREREEREMNQPVGSAGGLGVGSALFGFLSAFGFFVPFFFFPARFARSSNTSSNAVRSSVLRSTTSTWHFTAA